MYNNKRRSDCATLATMPRTIQIEVIDEFGADGIFNVSNFGATIDRSIRARFESFNRHSQIPLSSRPAGYYSLVNKWTSLWSRIEFSAYNGTMRWLRGIYHNWFGGNPAFLYIHTTVEKIIHLFIAQALASTAILQPTAREIVVVFVFVFGHSSLGLARHRFQ